MVALVFMESVHGPNVLLQNCFCHLASASAEFIFQTDLMTQVIQKDQRLYNLH